MLKVIARVNKLQEKEGSNLLGYATLTIAEVIDEGTPNETVTNKFAVNGIKIMNGKNGPFASMPQGQPYEKNGEKIYPEHFFPVSKEAREELNAIILEEYNKA